MGDDPPVKRVAWDDLTVKIPASWACRAATVTLAMVTGLACAFLLVGHPAAWVFVVFSLFMAGCRDDLERNL